MKKIIFLILVLICSCVETDIVEDQIITLTIEVENENLTNNAFAALVNNTYSFKASAMSDLGGNFIPGVQWVSSNSNVASIDENGLLTTLASGMAFISAQAFGLSSNQIMVSVVDNSNEVALIEITSTKSMIQVDESVQLSARALNIFNEEIPDIAFNWTSENADIATVDNGLVIGVSEGSANIEVAAEGVIGKFEITVGMSNTRSGTFSGLSGYSVSGTTTLESISTGNLQLHLENDFQSSSGPGLYLYLSNNRTSVSGGIELGPLRSNSGADTYDVPNGISLDQYNYVLVYCKPFGVGFGTAELNP